jgi:exocyst complex component 1
VRLMRCDALENMHYFVAEIRKQEIGSVNAFSTRAEAVYEENLNAYVKIVLRRPFSKIIVSICGPCD